MALVWRKFAHVLGGHARSTRKQVQGQRQHGRLRVVHCGRAADRYAGARIWRKRRVAHCFPRGAGVGRFAEQMRGEMQEQVSVAAAAPEGVP